MINVFKKLFSKKDAIDINTLRKPTSCSLIVLNRCCLKCIMCHMWHAPVSESEITIKECCDIVDQLTEILEGDRELIISGGEPLLKEGITELISYAHEKGLKTIMPTNGYLLDLKKAKALVEAGLDELFISLDSYNEKTHDFLRGQEGAFNQVKKAVEYVAAQKGDTRINYLAVISQYNLTEIINLLERAHADPRVSGVYFQVIAKPFFTECSDNWRDEERFGALWPEQIDEACAVIDEILARKRKGYVVHNHEKQLELYKRYFKDPYTRVHDGECYLGEYTINIDHEGNVNACCFGEALGNVRKESLKKIWFSEEAIARRSAMHSCKENCHNLVNCFFKENEVNV